MTGAWSGADMRTAVPLPPGLLRTALQQEGLVDSEQCDAVGLGTARRGALRRAGLLERVVRGVHDVAPALDAAGVAAWQHVDRWDRARRRAAWLGVLAVGRARGVAVGACALALLGVEGLPARIRPEVALLDGTHRVPGGGVHVRCGVPERVERLGPVMVVDPVTALVQTVPTLDREHAVAVLDSAIHRRLVREDELEDVRRRTRGRRGSARATRWWDLVDGRAQSPLETRARLQCRDAGIAPHDLQVAVRDGSGRVVARGDLGWWLDDGRLLLVEIDGATPHGAPDALYRDRARQNAIVATGALLLRFTADDLRHHRVAEEVARHVTPSATRDGAVVRPGSGR